MRELSIITSKTNFSCSQLVLHDLSDLDSAGDGDGSSKGGKTVTSVLPDLKTVTKGAKKSVKFDETTVAEIATVAPEQHRMLTSARQALNMDENEESPSSGTQMVDNNLEYSNAGGS
jgi:hypothetical protein